MNSCRALWHDHLVLHKQQHNLLSIQAAQSESIQRDETCWTTPKRVADRCRRVHTVPLVLSTTRYQRTSCSTVTNGMLVRIAHLYQGDHDTRRTCLYSASTLRLTPDCVSP